MVLSARNLAAAVLVAGIALSTPLHGSPVSGGQPATGRGAGILSWSAAELWSGEWLYDLLHSAWVKAGGTLDPNGNSNANTSQPSNPSAGPGLGPDGTKVRVLRPVIGSAVRPFMAD